MNKETLYKFFEDLSSLEEEIQIRQWMERSSENEEIFFRERKLFDAATILISNKKSDTKQKKLKTFALEILKIASAILLTLGIGYFYSDYKDSQKNIAMQSITVPSGQRINISLPDGTNVWLNARSTLKYPTSFNTNQRIIELDGEAYFEVIENKKIPFIVQTLKADVEVLGTTFDIDAYSDKEKFETTLMEGSVKVSAKNREENTIILTPNNKVSLINGEFVIEKVDDFTSYRWIEGLICFKDEHFNNIMKEFEKYYGVSIQVNNKKVQQYTFTGKFRHTDGIDHVLRVLQKDIKFKYYRDHDNQIIYIE